MSDDPEDARSDGDDEVIDEFAAERGLEDETWIEDGDKYRCPECGAVQEERADGCSVCGWQRT